MSILAGMTIDDIPVVNLPESRPGRGDEVEIRDFTPNEEFDIQNVFEVPRSRQYSWPHWCSCSRRHRWSEVTPDDVYS